ncbi:MAG: cupin domain-containing protein [Acidimicrobiales bacterium]
MVVPPFSKVPSKRYRFGRLYDPSTAPPQGEVDHLFVQGAALSVHQVLSGKLASAVGYCQAEDEWALLLEGAALLEVAGEAREMGPGDWVWLPAGTPHRLVSTRPGTSWVTVHAQAG